MNKITLKGKNVLVTGAKGFVGTNLMQKLHETEANVYGLSHSSSSKSIIKGNVLDYKKISNLVKNKKITICFHLAGEALVESGQDKPYETFHTNVKGTLNILEIARTQGLERVIIASTSHVYGRNRLPYFEGYTPRPSRPYETSKACTDLIAQSYADTFNLPVLIPRFVNIYGPGDLNFNRLIPRTIKTIMEGSPPAMWGGEALRDYLYIEDAIDAYILLSTVNLEKVGKNRVFNFGTSNIISVKDLIEKIVKISGRDLRIKNITGKREGEILSQYVSFNKANRLLKWEAKINLDKGLDKTISWYENFFNPQ